MVMNAKLRLMVIESHPVVSAGLSKIFGSQPDMIMVSEASTLEEGLAQLKAKSHDVVVMDQRSRGCDSIYDLKKVRQAGRGAKILIFSAREGDGDVLRALKNGAAGYLLKSASRQEIVEAIRKVAESDRYLAPSIALRLAETIGRDSLTDRELEVLALVREGWRNRQIACRLKVAETTVNFHIKNTLSKLAANDRTHAVTIAMRRGLLSVVA